MSLPFNKPSEVFRFLYLCGIGIMVISLPIFNVGMSVATIWIGVSTIVYFFLQKFFFKEEDLKIRNPFKNPLALAILSIYLMHVISLLYSQDLDYAFNDLRIKIPLFTLPFSLAFLPRLNKKEYQIILALFIASVTFSVLSCLLVYWKLTSIEYTDVRKITVTFITRVSHIRLSLLVVLALAVLYYYRSNFKINRMLVILLSLLYFYFLIILQSVTGWIILLGLGGILIIYLILNLKNTAIRKWVAATGIVAFGIIIFASIDYVNSYFKVNEANNEILEFSEAGEKFQHDLNNRILQNNNYIYINIARNELSREWNKRSQIPFQGKDQRTHYIEHTAIRYLASLGLTKDSVGISKLSDQDIKNIETGMIDAEWKKKSSIAKRFDAILFEFDNARFGGNPSGNSVVQRLEYWKAALAIFSENKWIGVGSGDVQNEFQSYYSKSNSSLSEKYRLRAHNQYLTIAVSFGMVGFLWFIFVLVYSILKNKNYKNFLFLCFFVISVFSFLAEDTIETQAGVTFFAFFFSFFLFQNYENESNSSILE